MLDSFNRKINYLRISVTDRCNQRCYYCFPNRDACFVKSEEILSFEEILKIVDAATQLGIEKIKITGGEPLVRHDITTLIAMLAKVPRIKDLSMTTNGTLLSKYAVGLKRAGLHRINVSLDAIDPLEYKKITGCDNLNDVISGIEVAKKAGFESIKINCVIQDSKEVEHAKDVKAFADKNGFDIKYIRKMDLEKGKFWPIEGGTGGTCSNCNRLRLSSDGKIYPCLFSDLSFSTKKLGPEVAIKQAILYKPESGKNSSKKFHTIGG